MEESNGEEHEPEPRRPSNIRRASVCAEKLCAVRVGSEIVKRIPKSEEELEKIHGILIQCVLFEHLDESQLQTVKDAMFPVTKEEEEQTASESESGTCECCAVVLFSCVSSLLVLPFSLFFSPLLF